MSNLIAAVAARKTFLVAQEEAKKIEARLLERTAAEALLAEWQAFRAAARAQVTARAQALENLAVAQKALGEAEEAEEIGLFEEARLASFVEAATIEELEEIEAEAIELARGLEQAVAEKAEALAAVEAAEKAITLLPMVGSEKELFPVMALAAAMTKVGIAEPGQRIHLLEAVARRNLARKWAAFYAGALLPDEVKALEAEERQRRVTLVINDARRNAGSKTLPRSVLFPTFKGRGRAMVGLDWAAAFSGSRALEVYLEVQASEAKASVKAAAAKAAELTKAKVAAKAAVKAEALAAAERANARRWAETRSPSQLRGALRKGVLTPAQEGAAKAKLGL